VKFQKKTKTQKMCWFFFFKRLKNNFGVVVHILKYAEHFVMKCVGFFFLLNAIRCDCVFLFCCQFEEENEVKKKKI
jgi:hypothetical protein